VRLTTDWLNEVLTKEPKEAWKDIFDYIKTLVPRNSIELKTLYQKLESEVGNIDHVLASSAWDLWEQFSQAPRGSDYVKHFWANTIGPKAVLILDSLSIREVFPICEQITKFNGVIDKVDFSGSEIPSETDIYANALGAPGRFSIAQNQRPAHFFISKGDAYIDTFKKIPFAETAIKIPNEKNIFIWHGWPDDSIHDMGKIDNAFDRFIEHVRDQITSDGFKNLIDTLSRGRTLLITSDHGYCNTSSFTPAQNAEHKELKTLGHTRAKGITSADSIQGMTIPPATMELKSTSSNDLYRVAVGRRRPNDKGFPALTYGGLSIMECTVPLIQVRGNHG